jgi:4-hydroxy-tetrahydrodipicolinate synthase
MYDAYETGDVATARALHHRLVPAYVGFFRTQGVITTKAALAMLGLPAGLVRAPLVDATTDEKARLRADLAAAGLRP